MVLVCAVLVWCLGVEARESDDDLNAHWDNNSMGKGKMMVEFFSALIELSVWR